MKAYGLNRAELHLRRRLADGLRFPIVPGIEPDGTADAAPGGDLRSGQQVAALWARWAAPNACGKPAVLTCES